MSSTTTLKLPSSLKARVARVARRSGRSPHSMMVEAIRRQTERDERMEVFVREALASERAIEAGEEVYAADEVHAWLERLARGKKGARPKPWRG
jgi:predicted transcriptional regulator